jgi:cell filamentation protein
MENIYHKESEDERWNSYFYPGTTTFINKLGITDDNELYKVEREICEEKVEELKKNPIKGNFDSEHLRAIHDYLFNDLYDWAGKYRDVSLTKEEFSTVVAVVDIERCLKEDFDLLNQNMRMVYNLDTFAETIADCYIGFGKIHPFREGNGRAIREFLREFVEYKSQMLGFDEYTLDWDLIDNDKITKLMPLSFGTSTLIQMEIKKGLVPYINEKEKIK